MEIQRTLVIVGLAIVTYMMVLAWQEDYGRTDPPATAQTAQHDANSAAEDVAAAPGADEVPQASDIPSAVAEPVVEAGPVKPVSKARQVQVATDVLRLTIDLHGGDLQRLALPAYPLHADTPDQPFPLLSSSNERVQVVQSGLIGPDGTDTKEGRPLWDSQQSEYVLDDDESELAVDLTLTRSNGLEIIKRYTFMRGSYEIGVSHIIRNGSDTPWNGALYGQIKRDSSEDPGKNKAGFAPMPTFLGAAWWTDEKPYNKTTLDDLQDEPLKITEQGGWIAMVQHYFVTAWVPDSNWRTTYSSVYLPQAGQYLLRFVSPSVTVAPGDEHVLYANLYAGPKDQAQLEAISPGLNMTVDYGWLWFISQPIFALLIFLQSGHISLFGNEFDVGIGVGNWGVAIILLTLVIKLLFFKLSATSYRSMAKMRKVAPEMQRIREQYKTDRQKQQMETMKLFQREKINPLGGCLPMLIQMPVFIALYYVLLESVELRQAPFFLWINDLSVMDPYFVLPLLMGASMFVQSRLNPTPADPTQAQVMKWMPVIFTVFMLWFPAGLVLYWLTNNVLSIAQQWVITRKLENE